LIKFLLVKITIIYPRNQMHFFILSMLACLFFVENVHSSAQVHALVERAAHAIHKEPVEQKVASPDKNQIIPSQIAAALPMLPDVLQQLVGNYAREWPLLQNMNFTANYTFLSENGLYLIMQRALYRLHDGKFTLAPKPSELEKLKQKMSNYMHATSATQRPSIILEIGKDEVEIEYIKNNVSLYDPIFLTLPLDYKPQAAAASEDGNCVITHSAHSFDIWMRDDKGIYQHEYESPLNSKKVNIAISANGKSIALVDGSDVFVIVNVNGKCISSKNLGAKIDNVTSLAVSADGSLVKYGNKNGKLFSYKIEGNQLITNQLASSHPIKAVAISADQAYMATLQSPESSEEEKESIITVWKLDKNSDRYIKLSHLIGDKKSIASLLFSSDSKYLIALFKDKNEYTIKTWQVKDK
jgi:hypothetical protein